MRYARACVRSCLAMQGIYILLYRGGSYVPGMYDILFAQQSGIYLFGMIWRAGRGDAFVPIPSPERKQQPATSMYLSVAGKSGIPFWKDFGSGETGYNAKAGKGVRK